MLSTVSIVTLFGQQQRNSFEWESSLAAAKENYNHGDYPKAMKVALSVYQSSLKTGNKAVMADAGNLIGLVDLAEGKPKQALAHFRKALQLNQGLGNNRRVAANLINIGLAHSDLSELDSAILSLRQSLELSEQQGIKNLATMAHNHLGELHFKQGRLTTAQLLFRSVLDDKAYQSDWENSFASAGMSKIYFARKEFRKAAIFADRAYQLALKADAKWDAAKAMELAHVAYRQIGNMSKAYERLLAYKVYSDSLFNADKEKGLNVMRLRSKSIENDYLHSQIKLVGQQRKIDRLVIAVTVTVLILIITIAVQVFRSHRRAVLNNRMLKAEKDSALLQNELFASQNEELNLVNQDRNRLFSIIGHDLRSPLASISHTLTLFKSGYLDHHDLILLADKLQAEVGTASGMLNSLLVWSANQMQGIRLRLVNVDLALKVNKVIGSLLSVANHKQIKLIHDPHHADVVRADADQVRIMIHNLLSNAIKFTPEGGHVKIYYVTSVDHLDLVIEDNGVGMTSEKLSQLLNGEEMQTPTYGTNNEKGIGLGLHLVRDFAANNKVTLMGKSTLGKGTSFILRFQRSVRD